MARLVTTVAAIAALLMGAAVGWTWQQWQPSELAAPAAAEAAP